MRSAYLKGNQDAHTSLIDQLLNTCLTLNIRDLSHHLAVTHSSKRLTYPGWGWPQPTPSGILHPEFPRINSMAVTVTII